MNIKIENIYKVIKNAKLYGLDVETKWFKENREWSASALSEVCRIFLITVDNVFQK